VSGDLFEHIRTACAEVARRAQHVRIDAAQVSAFGAELAAAADEPSLDPAHTRLDDAAATLAYVITLDAINFGSGWFPYLHKGPGLSGYRTIAAALKQRFERKGPWSARELCGLSGGECAAVFGQESAGSEAAELMELFARALRQLGAWLETRHAGRFDGPVAAAAGSAERLVGLLAEMEFYRDEARYQELRVPLYKRAQLTASDLAAAFGGEGWGRFRDLDRLTLFADNLVPHVLRCEGVLVYAPELARRIEAEEVLAAGSPEEVEIRAVAVHAVEQLVAACARAGRPTTAARLDHWLWNRGQRPELKARPRHRTRSVYY
jgi:hypothetical protein